MSEKLQKIALEYLLQQAPVLLMLVDQHGNVLRTNHFTSELIGSGEGSTELSNVCNGLSASDLAELARDPIRTRLLNINTSSRYPRSMMIRAYQVDEGILVLGNPDSADLELIMRQLFVLNGEINNTVRELHKKNAELEQLNQLKTQFLGMAAHDLRTPLSSVMLLCDLLADNPEFPLNQGQSRFVEAISQSAEKMRVLIEDFLNSAVIESGNLSLDLQPMELSAAIENAASIQRPLAASRGISLHTHVPEDCPALCADPAKLEQVLNNLISNAIEYSAANSEVEIMCSFSCDEVTVAVKDRGQGISQQDIANLFRPFSTTGATKGSGQKSTGLGLFISHKIVEAHRGRTWVESELGAGSTFHFSLPIAN